MSGPERRVRRAILLTPVDDRERYAPEWAGDLAGAQALGLSRREVARGAMTVAMRLRMRWWGGLLAGRQGRLRAASGWLVLAGLVMLLAVLALPVLLLGVLVGPVLLIRRASTSLAQHLMTACYLLWLGCLAVYWWLTGIAQPALEANAPMPAVVNTWSSPVVFAGLAAFAGFWIVFGASGFTRRKSD